MAISQKPRRPTKKTVELVATKKQLKRRSQTTSTMAFEVDITRRAPITQSGGNPMPATTKQLAAKLRPALSLSWAAHPGEP